MPRKPLPPEKRKSKPVQVMLTQEEHSAFDAWCSQNGVTMSDFIREAINQPIQDGRKLLE
ncbi:MAG: plasmid partition protein ParG [Cyanobacteria bacterium P01_D01_bin.156]